jgi:heme-degrading monooxygenase HmoA
MYTIVWRFTVQPGQASAFELHYGPEGTWAELFRKAAGYYGTRLYRDVATPGIYVTVDQWETEAAFNAFMASNRDAYKALDARFAALTVSEEKLGALTP